MPSENISFEFDVEVLASSFQTTTAHELNVMQPGATTASNAYGLNTTENPNSSFTYDPILPNNNQRNVPSLMTQSYPNPSNSNGNPLRPITTNYTGAISSFSQLLLPNTNPQVTNPTQVNSNEILQPEKVSKFKQNQPTIQMHENAADFEGQTKPNTTLDKNLLAELEKNLGLAEVNANLMPPSPMPTSMAANKQMVNSSKANEQQIFTSDGAIPKKNFVPVLQPPPQSNNKRSDNRRYTTAIAKASPPIVQGTSPSPNTSQYDTLSNIHSYKERSRSLSRKTASSENQSYRQAILDQNSGLRVALPPHSSENSQLTRHTFYDSVGSSQNTKTTAHVKPFDRTKDSVLSDLKQMEQVRESHSPTTRSGMGDVASVARSANWKTLNFNMTGGRSRATAVAHASTASAAVVSAAAHEIRTANESRHYQPLYNEDITPTGSPWPPLNDEDDNLREQRRQFAEIERLRNSRSFLPPSGASRPANHLEINKLAQVNKFYFLFP